MSIFRKGEDEKYLSLLKKENAELLKQNIRLQKEVDETAKYRAELKTLIEQTKAVRDNAKKMEQEFDIIKAKYEEELRKVAEN